MSYIYIVLSSQFMLLSSLQSISEHINALRMQSAADLSNTKSKRENFTEMTFHLNGFIVLTKLLIK